MSECTSRQAEVPRKISHSLLLAATILFAAVGCAGEGGADPSASNSGPSGLVPTTLSWQKPTTNDDGSSMTDLAGFQIYYSDETPVTTANSESIPILNPNQTSYVMWDLPPGTYHFTVTAVNLQGGESSMSNEATKTIL